MHQCLPAKGLPTFFRRQHCLSPSARSSRSLFQPQLCRHRAFRYREDRACFQLPGRAFSTAATSNSSFKRNAEPQREESSSILQHSLVASALLVALTALSAAPAHALSTEAVASMAASKLPAIGGDPAFREGVVSGFLLILFSELGDKTFFIALLLALKQSQGLVFLGTFGALGIMTVISVALGQVLHQIDELLPANSLPWDDIFAAVLLVFFGIKTLLLNEGSPSMVTPVTRLKEAQDAKDADESAAEERGEAEEEVSRLGDGEALSFVASTFVLVFLAEWGDKSFLATIALAAASSPSGVVLGAVGGHGVATGIAVVGGSYLSRFLSEKVVAYVGGSLFLVFAASTIYDIFGKVTS